MKKNGKIKISWYRTPIERNELRGLFQRSDWKGLLQSVGYLGLLIMTGTAACCAVGRLPWYFTILIFFIHGTFYAFLINACHELTHGTVFKTKFLNTLFVQFFSFLYWHSDIFFWSSHTEHHKYTLHPPDDLEVVLPTDVSLKSFLLFSFVNPLGFYNVVRTHLRHSRGKIDGKWEKALFGESAPEKKRSLFNWARFLLASHAALTAVSIYLGYWQIPVVITLAPFYGGWLFYLCNNTQHTGLRDNVNDFRLCCRSITLNPFLTFLYWQMNYHTEHHMHANVPCYNLKKLHQLIKHDLPPCRHGLVATWREIIATLKKQKVDPKYHYRASLPARGLAP